MSNTTRKEAVLEALRNSERGLTAAQIEARFGVANPTALISDLRYDGYAIYANAHTDSKGRTKTFYRLGTPTRAMVRAAFTAQSAGLVDSLV